MTPAALRNHTCKDLAQMAKKQGIPGWHSMRKDELVQALLKSERNRKRKSRRSSGRAGGSARRNGASAKKKSASNGKASQAKRRKSDSRARKRINQFQEKLQRAKDLATPLREDKAPSDMVDRVVVMVRDPYWLHVYWELTRRSIARAQAAMGQHWHTARPQLRLYEVTGTGESTGSDTHVRSIDIHGGVNNWYIDVQDPPKSFRVEIGYQDAEGGFHAIARSNVVTTPPAATRDSLDENWVDVAENVERIYALSGGYSAEGTSQELRELLEERLRRPMGDTPTRRFAAGGHQRNGEFHLEVDAELIVYGFTRPDGQVMLKGEPVQVRSDGSFAVRLNLPDCRQVIPVVANSSDGVEQRTVALAVERNTKRMETVIHDAVS